MHVSGEKKTDYAADCDKLEEGRQALIASLYN
jgi:hypothetical protein